MVRRVERQVLGLARPRRRTLAPKLKRHLQRDFHRRRAIVRKEDMFESRRSQLDQPSRQPDRGRIRHPQRRDMRHPAQLLDDRRVDPRMPMPVDVAPQAAHAVQVSPAIQIEQLAPLRPLDHKRLVFRHLRERVPNVLAIPSQQFGTRRSKLVFVRMERRHGPGPSHVASGAFP